LIESSLDTLRAELQPIRPGECSQLCKEPLEERTVLPRTRERRISRDERRQVVLARRTIGELDVNDEISHMPAPLARARALNLGQITTLFGLPINRVSAPPP
jgi:hypothetical protein